MGKKNYTALYFSRYGANSLKWSVMGASTLHGRGPWLMCEVDLKATSHTRLKAPNHGNVRALIGQKDGDRPSSLRTRRWRPKGPKEKFVIEKSTWSPTWQVVDKGAWSTGICIMPNTNSGRPCFFDFFFSSNRTNFKTDGRVDSKIDSKTDKHHQVVILLTWYNLRHIILNQILPSFSANKICNGPATWFILTSHYAWGPKTT